MLNLVRFGYIHGSAIWVELLWTLNSGVSSSLCGSAGFMVPVAGHSLQPLNYCRSVLQFPKETTGQRKQPIPTIAVVLTNVSDYELGFLASGPEARTSCFPSAPPPPSLFMDSASNYDLEVPELQRQLCSRLSRILSPCIVSEWVGGLRSIPASA